MDSLTVPGKPSIGAPGLVAPGVAMIGQGGLNAPAAGEPLGAVTYAAVPLTYQSAPITYV